MAANIERLISSPLALQLATSLAWAMPPKLGYSFADRVARWIGSHPGSGYVQAIRANQAIITGGQEPGPGLEHAVQAVLGYSAHSIYELYHYLQRPAELVGMYCLEPSFQSLFDRLAHNHDGLVLAGLHMAGFDLGLQWLGMHQFRPLVLTIPDPTDGRRMEFETRKKTGMAIVPGSVAGLRQAIRHLEQGGMVMTGIDHPAPGGDPGPLFFGQPSALPVHHVFVALKAHAPIVVVASYLTEDGKYHLSASSWIKMEPYADRTQELLINAEHVLGEAQEFISKHPQQWLISLPVWPKAANSIPAVG
jgi:KDO2-lipid IV(A) lauroyltransferase